MRVRVCVRCRNYWEFRRHFPDLADTLYASLDSATQRALERERDGTESNGTNSMSASLRGSNSSLNSMPNSVISMCQLSFMSISRPISGICGICLNKICLSVLRIFHMQSDDKYRACEVRLLLIHQVCREHYPFLEAFVVYTYLTYISIIVLCMRACADCNHSKQHLPTFQSVCLPSVLSLALVIDAKPMLTKRQTCVDLRGMAPPLTLLISTTLILT